MDSFFQPQYLKLRFPTTSWDFFKNKLKNSCKCGNRWCIFVG